jgi:PAS domain S-box-containing protein
LAQKSQISVYYFFAGYKYNMDFPADAWLCRRLVEESRDAVIFADRAGIIRFWNAGAAELFGYPSQEALGQPLDLIIPEKLRARHAEGYRRVMACGVTRYGKELLAVPGLRKDGARLSLEFTIALIKDEAGEVLGAGAIIRDVTARFLRDRELRRRLTALEEQLPQRPGAEPG